MKKIMAVATIVIVLGIMASEVFAINDARISAVNHENSVSQTSGTRYKRVITSRNSGSYRKRLVSEGCKVIRELKGAIAVECPDDVYVSNAEVDTVFYVLDATSNSQIKADDAWESGYTGSGVTVAVLDTGVDITSPELVSSIVGGKSFVSYTTSYIDDYGHGTHVAGIITADGINANAKGAAPDAGIWVAKVCDYRGTCYASDIAAAIEYVVNNHIAKVISISVGGGGTSEANCDSDYLASKINWAYDNGVVAIIAAGNSGSNIVSSPACASKAVAVAAVDKYDNFVSFNGYGNALRDHGVVAPGVNIFSSVPTSSCPLCSSTGYSYLSGTSMATPHVSAIVALMLQKNPSMTPNKIRSTIFSFSDCLDNKYGTCPNDFIGYGRIDAVDILGPPLPPEFNPPEPPEEYPPEPPEMPPLPPEQTLSVEAEPTSIQINQASTITVATNPTTAGVSIYCSVAGGLGSIADSTCITGSDGSCSVKYDAPSTSTTANISCSANGWTTDSTSVQVTESTYKIKFFKSGLPSRTSWSVIVDGVEYTTTSSRITVYGLTGTVEYSFESPVWSRNSRYVCKRGCSGFVTSGDYSKTAVYRRG